MKHSSHFAKVYVAKSLNPMI